MAQLPVVEQIIGLLQACRQQRNVPHAKQLHAYMRKHGLESNGFLGNYLVPLLVDCGCLPEARLVFDRLDHRNEYSWTSLISGYVESGESQHALDIYHIMHRDHVQPNSYTFATLLKASADLQSADTGREMHADTIRWGLERDYYVGNALVDMYGRCNALIEAHEVFDRLPARNIVSWTALMAGYAEHGYNHEALICFEQMELAGGLPDGHIYVCCLKVCGSIGSLEKGRLFCAEITKRGLERDPFVGSTMVYMYAKCGSLVEAQVVLDLLPVRNAVSWTALIAGYTDRGFGEEALKHLKEMQLDNMSPAAVTYACSLKACSIVKHLESGQEIHNEIITKGLERDHTVANTLVDMYGKCGALIEGRKVFEELPVKDVVSLTTLLNGYGEKHQNVASVHPNTYTFVAQLKTCTRMKDMKIGQQTHCETIKKGLETHPFIGNTLVDMYGKCGLLAEAQKVFDRISTHDTVSWNALIAGYAEHGCSDRALTCLDQMVQDGVLPVDLTFVCSLKACGSTGALEEGRQLHAEIVIGGLERDLFVANSLVDMYAKCGSIAEGLHVFDKLSVRDIVSWNTLIKAYGDIHAGDMAIDCFEDMQEQGVKPDCITFTCLLVACSHANLVLKGQEYFKVMTEHYKIEPLLDHCTCIVDLLARAGHVCEAERFAESMQCLSSESILRTLLNACKNYGKMDLGQRCFQQLVQLNKEDATTYLLMAEIYASSGRLDDAKKIEEMRKQAGAKKKLAIASIETNKKMHEFVVGHHQSKDITTRVDILSSRMKIQGYVPVLDLVLTNKFDESMEATLFQVVVNNSFDIACHKSEDKVYND